MMTMEAKQIKLLSNKTINKIAAGEVIERPASAVKELVENAIDAGATQIDIRLEQAGKNLISISDNGFGMSKEDLELSIKRHATSKLDEDDLLNIHSFGFRGEALPSIGAISRMKITSRSSDSDSAYSINVEGGEISEATPCARNIGTTIEVRDLFFATPARLKFLRTDRSEFNSIVSVVKNLASCYPLVNFSLNHNGKDVLLFKKSADGNEFEESFKKRISEILGPEFIENSCQLNFANDKIEIHGYTSLPTFNKATSQDQYLFINNRPVKDKLLNVALRVAYKDFMAKDRFPVCVLFLKMPTKFVDVNVHPAKTEVRFYDPMSVKGMFVGAIKDALNTTSHRVSNTGATNALKYMQKGLEMNSTENSDSMDIDISASGQSQKSTSQPDITSQPHMVLRENDTPGLKRFDEELGMIDKALDKQENISDKVLDSLGGNIADSDDARSAEEVFSSLFDNRSKLKSRQASKDISLAKIKPDYDLAMNSNISEELSKDNANNSPSISDESFNVTSFMDTLKTSPASQKEFAAISDLKPIARSESEAPRPEASQIFTGIETTNTEAEDTAIDTIPTKDIENTSSPNFHESKKFPLGAAKAQLHNTYIIAQTEDSIVIVDQHAAHERLGYEKIKQKIAKDGLDRQRLLIPEIIEMKDEYHADTLQNHSKEIANLGMSLERFGDKSIIVSEVPSIIGDTDVTKLIMDIADHLIESGDNVALSELIEHITETYACHYSIRAGRSLSVSEMNEMLRQMEDTAFSGQCNHGRPTYVELKLKDIEKLFGRR